MSVTMLRVIEEDRPAEYADAGAVIDSETAAAALRPVFGRDPRELFVAMPLDAKNRPLGIHIVSVGTASASLVHPREALRICLLTNAVSVIFAHNHPSGDPTPSRQDVEVTRLLANAGYVLGVAVLDHIIIGRDRHYSFADDAEHYMKPAEGVRNAIGGQIA